MHANEGVQVSTLGYALSSADLGYHFFFLLLLLPLQFSSVAITPACVSVLPLQRS